jgi:hypothetical protein
MHQSYTSNQCLGIGRAMDLETDPLGHLHHTTPLRSTLAVLHEAAKRFAGKRDDRETIYPRPNPLSPRLTISAH